MIASLRAYAYAFFAALVAFGGVMLYRMGSKNATQKVVEDDYENAEDIRRRVSTDRADKLRKLDDAGWLD